MRLRTGIFLRLLDDVLKRLHRAAILRLAEPEERPLPEVGVGIALGDLDELVEGSRLIPLGVDEDELLPHLPIGHPSIESRQLADRDSTLAGPEECLLPHLDSLRVVLRHTQQPAAVLFPAHLRQREEDFLLEIAALEPSVQSPEEGGILRRLGLSQPEDRLLPE